MANFILSAFADEASGTLEGQIDALKRNGIRWIEPRNVNGSLVEKTDAEFATIGAVFKTAGIRVSSLGSPIGKYDIDKPFEDHLQTFRRALRACEILGTRRMRMFSFFVPQDRLAECRNEVLRRLRVLLDEAKAAGVTLCHENESRIYGQNPAEVRDLLTSLPDLRGVFDPANYVMNDQDPIEGIEAMLPSLEYLHIKDAIMAKKSIVPCGHGDGQIAEVLRRVDTARDGTVFLSVEPHLHIFDAYRQIDAHELKNEYSFETADEAFDYAVTSLKETLQKIGYHEEDGIWKK
ncbi:MAG: sugar phosphate isomerase/epimerase [Clostridia bacterium]|nr:sugar phosphate isomerase/epimerase [Clostridia bacterium]